MSNVISEKDLLTRILDRKEIKLCLLANLLDHEDIKLGLRKKIDDLKAQCNESDNVVIAREIRKKSRKKLRKKK